MSTIPSFPRFIKIDLDFQSEIQAFTQQYPGYSDFNFTNLYSWNNDGGIAVSWLHNNLVIRFRDYVSGETFYTFLGRNQLDRTAQTLLGEAHLSGCASLLKLIPEEIALSLLTSGRFILREDQDNHDYILSVTKLAGLVGRPQSHTRELVNRFKREHGSISKVVQLDLHSPQTILDIMEIFHERENLKLNNDKANEQEAILRLLQQVSDFNLMAYGIRVQNQLRAFIICEILENQPVLAHFWKADTQLRGIYHYLLHSVALELQKLGHQLLNFEQDLGIPGLRAAKQFLRPEQFLRKYTVALPDALFETKAPDNMQRIRIADVRREYAGAID